MAVVFRLIYCVNDFWIDFLRRLRSPVRLDGNENSMFRHPLRLLEENFKAETHNATTRGDMSLRQVASSALLLRQVACA